MFLTTLVLAGSFVLALGPPAVLSRFHSITFSPVKQCGNFTVLFSGGEPPASLPLTLTVVPFNATPTSIEIPVSSWNETKSTGALITFLPFPAGTEFVASLDDGDGVSTGLVSDVIRVDESVDSSCLSPVLQASTSKYIVDMSVSQCESFGVTYDSTTVDVVPTVRAFIPRNISFIVNQSTPVDAPGYASFTMEAFRGQQVVLLLSDDTGYRESTRLLSVGGNSDSPTTCLPPILSAMHSATQFASSTNKSSLSKGAIITIGVVSAIIVGGVALAMAVWLVRERRKFDRRNFKTLEEVPWEKDKNLGRLPDFTVEKRSQTFDPEASPVTARSSLPPGKAVPRIPARAYGSSGDVSSRNGFVKNPLYTDAKFEFVSPSSPQFHTTIPPSLVLPGQELPLSSIPVPLVSPQDPSSTLGTKGIPQSSSQQQNTRSRPSSLSSDDIEHILEMATMYSAPPTPNNATQTIIMHDSLSPMVPTVSERAAARVSSRVLRVGPAGIFTIVSPSDVLLPSRAVTYRNPPQVPLPSSPNPVSPAITDFRRSDLATSIRTSGSDLRGLGDVDEPPVTIPLPHLPPAHLRLYKG